MALLDTPQAMYNSMTTMTSQYLIQNGYNRNNYYRDYEQDIARLNIQQRLHASPEQQYDYRARLFVKEERLGGGGDGAHQTAFKPYSPGQENLPHQANQPAKVTLSNCHQMIRKKSTSNLRTLTFTLFKKSDGVVLNSSQ